MKRRCFVVLLTLVLTLLLAGCGCKHEWYAATCTAPKTCSLCGKTDGDVLPHTWQDATCTVAKTCSVCEATDGEPAGHTWQDATCTVAKTCSVCNTTEGEPMGHTWQDATTEAPKTCSVCNTTEGSKLETDSRFTTKATKDLQGIWSCETVLTDEMMGLSGFGNLECTMTLKFGNTGEISVTAALKDEPGFLIKMKQYTVEEMYAAFALDGLSREQSDQAMLDTYGLNVNDYVDVMLKGYDPNSIFEAFTFEGVYYVEDGTLYTALSWKATFEKDNYTLENGTLVIDSFSLEEGGTPLIWTKASKA